MEVPYYIVGIIGAVSLLNSCVSSCHGRRLKTLEEKVKRLEERPIITTITTPSSTQTNQATAPYLPPPPATYTRPLYSVPTPQINGIRATAPPAVPVYYAGDPQSNQTYQYGKPY